MVVDVGRGYAKGRAKRREIIDRAMTLFGEVGYRGASLREIAARCGISHPGLLHHFPTKESLLLAVLEHRDEVDGVWGVAEDDDPVDGMRRLVEVVERNVGRRPIVELYAVLSAEATSADHPAHDYFQDRYRRTLAAVQVAYERAREGGALRADVDPATAARQLVALMDGLQVQWLLDDGATDMVGAVRDLVGSQLVRPL
ncbi:TetR/AcrR family transcriptional regulator [Cellulomonas sp. C5510]|uniref:TetR/AcrR family transcriptional regulator n=1 Tax=Cellulomonas sp. C5510 TaxID=2871170 RepID=UPI001C97E1BD|nr:TetR/AcrR family transcriptional regulator [Cellulomonas sp. C5510]QZN85295.1 TetR/AcrR family transcriptional regulator [Cellulomonas sp. C5510]